MFIIINELLLVIVGFFYTYNIKITLISQPINKYIGKILKESFFRNNFTLLSIIATYADDIAILASEFRYRSDCSLIFCPSKSSQFNKCL